MPNRVHQRDAARTQTKPKATMHSTSSRTGAFALANPYSIAVGIRRPAGAAAGYELWQLEDRPFVVATESLPALSVQEFRDLLNWLVKLDDVRSLGGVADAVMQILAKHVPDEEAQVKSFTELAR